MASSPRETEVVRVSQKGQATIPQSLREEFGIETPGEVFVYEDDGRIVVEPVPSMEELHGMFADDGDDGALARARELDEIDRRLEREKTEAILERYGDEE